MLLIFNFLELVYTKTSNIQIKQILFTSYKFKLEKLINYFIEFDLDSKGITNLAFYCEEEFFEKKKKFGNQEHRPLGQQ